MVKVTKEKFDKFIKDYPSILDTWDTVEELRIRYYRDLSLPMEKSTYPFHNVTAQISMFWRGDSGEFDDKNTRKFWKYYLRTN